MSDIFEEVEEEVRKDRVAELWRKYGLFVWLAGFAIVAAVAFNEWRMTQQARDDVSRMTEFEAALDLLEGGQYGEAQVALQQLVDADTPLSPLAAQYLAQAYVEGSGDQAAAIATLDDAANGGGAAYQQLALLKSVYLRSETMTLAEMETELAPLIGQETPLAALAEELIAAAAYAEGDYERARREFNRLRFSAYAPPGLIQRATIALDTIPRTQSAAPESAGDPTDETEDTE